MANITIKQAAVALAAVTMAVARFLVENLLDASREPVSVLNDGVGEKRRT
jgi:hypothetical protein